MYVYNFVHTYCNIHIHNDIAILSSWTFRTGVARPSHTRGLFALGSFWLPELGSALDLGSFWLTARTGFFEVFKPFQQAQTNVFSMLFVANKQAMRRSTGECASDLLKLYGEHIRTKATSRKIDRKFFWEPFESSSYKTSFSWFPKLCGESLSAWGNFHWTNANVTCILRIQLPLTHFSPAPLIVWHCVFTSRFSVFQTLGWFFRAQAVTLQTLLLQQWLQLLWWWQPGDAFRKRHSIDDQISHTKQPSTQRPCMLPQMLKPSSKTSSWCARLKSFAACNKLWSCDCLMRFNEAFRTYEYVNLMPANGVLPRRPPQDTRLSQFTS